MNQEGLNQEGVPQPPQSRLDELERTCFVIMPFGKKDVGGREVDFTAVFTEVFQPAIEEVTTPENEPLLAVRTDMDAFSGSINQDMFEYIMYSRVAFADISGFNPNVFYEIGARHSAQESGTVLFRQTGHAIPFDITTIKVFEYDHQPADNAEASRAFITQVLSDSLKHNRLDSPIRLALRAQWTGDPEQKLATAESSRKVTAPGDQTPASTRTETTSADAWRKAETERFVRDAEEAARLGDLELAKTNYWGALRFDPLNIIARMRLGLTLKHQGHHYDALEEFTTIVKLAPSYGEAWREKGVVEGLIARRIPPDARKQLSWLADGYESLRRATKLIPNDFDAWSSLGGVLKNVRDDPAGAREAYAHAAKISHGHPYPLLNALKLEAQATGALDLDAAEDQLAAAERLRRGQVEADPPTDTPWSFFDLAELRLYQNDERGFIEFVNKGIASSNAEWQPKTFRDSLRTSLLENGIDLPGLAEGISLLNDALTTET